MKNLILAALFLPLICWSQNLSPIVQAEYFIDDDPGFGAATALNVSTGTTVVANPFSVNFQNLEAGVHFLYFRTKNQNNRWSVPVRRPFFVRTTNETLSKISAAEYYIDDDPGFGAANPISFSSSNTVQLQSLNAAIGNLETGIHFLYVRFKNTDNRWSVPVRKSFYVPPYSGALSPIVAAEYFIDEDPGIGEAQNVAVQSGTIVQQQVQLPYQNLSIGDHILYLRVKNDNGTWSIAKKEDFTITTLSTQNETLAQVKVYPNPTADIVKIEAGSRTVSNAVLFDFSGKRISGLQNSVSEIDLRNLTDGIYLLKIIFDDQSVLTKKIIKKTR